jgi:hypothetical protein
MMLRATSRVVTQRLGLRNRATTPLRSIAAVNNFNPYSPARRCISSIVPGSSSQYGSLGELPPRPSQPAAAWQAADNVDVQRVTQKAIVYELTQESSRMLETVVPWCVLLSCLCLRLQ